MIITENTHIAREKKLIDLLGYSLFGPNNSNRWIILDDNNNEVGYIQYKKIYKGNKKKNLSPKYAYFTLIDSSTVKYSYVQKSDGQPSTSYELDIKKDNDNIDHVEFDLDSEFSNSLTIWSTEYGYMSFRIAYNGLYFEFRSKTDNFNTRETVIYNSPESDSSRKEYTYQISFCDKDKYVDSENQKGIKSYMIGGINESYGAEPNTLEIVELKFVDGKEKVNKHYKVEGTVEEMAIKHKMGINAFNHFRYILDKILPFKEDVISIILDGKDEYSLFNEETNDKPKTLKK